MNIDDHPGAAARLAGLLGALAAAWALAAGAAAAKPEKQVAPDPGRSAPVHRIPLFNADGEAILPADKDAKPFSQKVSCGKCHDYEKIQAGWHFNAPDPNVPPGRPGEPWVLSDVATGTQIPVSGRGWPGTYKPAAIGLSSWRFVDKFGRQLPGGGMGGRFAMDRADPETDHWEATGNLTINCLGCHHVDFRQSGDEWAKNIERGNYLEADTAASGLAYVTGFVNRLPMTFDRMLGEAPDNPQFLPNVQYDQGRFNPKQEVFLDVSRRPPADRCYYCHSNHPVGKPEWQTQPDVHMARGFACTDCHRNGIGHKITRNYEGEGGAGEGFSCRGCHLGEMNAMTAALRKGGHAAAPRPAHKGLPKLHLDELSCTACHSGPYPTARAGHVQTARIHALGFHGIPFDPNAMPVVQEPVFVKQKYDGKIAVHRVLFPAFFGRLKDGKVTPLSPKAVMEAAGEALAAPAGKKPTPPTAEKVIAALKALGGGADAGEAVYVGGGKLRRLDKAGTLTASDNEAARPYSWPLAHDVRPAAQALGADGKCTDCHSTDSGFLFGTVAAEVPAAIGEKATVPMLQFEQEDETFHKLFALTFVFRPWLKVLGFFVSGVVVLILLAYGLPGLAVALKRFSRSAGES